MTPNFQLPLSGSHAHAKEEYGWDTVGYLSTPSLGITTHVVQVVDVAGGPNFQLPLSGSPRNPPALSMWSMSLLSTPSLGITEPDSGIFRLSAAFCRGTPSHK